MIIRIGDGQTTSGKILDRNTEYYCYITKGHNKCDERQQAIEAAIRTSKDIYISESNELIIKYL